MSSYEIRLNNFIEKWQKVLNDYYKTHYKNLSPPTLFVSVLMP